MFWNIPKSILMWCFEFCSVISTLVEKYINWYIVKIMYRFGLENRKFSNLSNSTAIRETFDKNWCILVFKTSSAIILIWCSKTSHQNRFRNVLKYLASYITYQINIRLRKMMQSIIWIWFWALKQLIFIIVLNWRHDNLYVKQLKIRQWSFYATFENLNTLFVFLFHKYEDFDIEFHRKHIVHV